MIWEDRLNVFHHIYSKEYGNKMMIISASYQFAVAWIAAFIVKTIGSIIFNGTSGSSILELLVGGVIILVSIFIVYKNIKSKQSGCSSCSGCSAPRRFC